MDHRGKARFILVVLASLVVLLMFAGCSPTGPKISLSQATALSKSGDIKSVELNSGKMLIIVRAGGGPGEIRDINGVNHTLEEDARFVVDIGDLSLADLQDLGFVLPEDYRTTTSSNISDFTFMLFPLLLLIFLFAMMFRGRGVPGRETEVVRSRARLAAPNRPLVMFDDVAGALEVKEDLEEVVAFLKDKAKFMAMGASVPKGVLLVGPPGTGKTLLARALAGEAGVPFFSVSGSEFVELYVGVGAARVRSMFEQAKQNAPCIIFIDEIDAIGRIRSGAGPGSHEEREQTLNQILVEMDGFDANIGVIVLAATNRPDVLDPALLRPGRFDRRITVERPDLNGRKAILEIYARGKSLEPSADLAVIARETYGFSGADLAALMNEAAILSVRRNKSTIGMNEIEESIDRVIAGPERKSIVMDPREKERTAYHEGGHALVARMLPNADPVHKVSIVARGGMGGFTRMLTEDRFFMTASQFKDTLATLFGGHAAEETVFGEISTGPHSDIKQATDLARRMVTEYGMSKKLGLRTYSEGPGGTLQRDYSDGVARQIDEEVHQILEEAYGVALRIIMENMPRLSNLVKRLMEKETLEGKELDRVFEEIGVLARKMELQ